MNTDDQIKLAQAQLVQHTAEQLGVDVNELSTEELAKFAAHVLAGEGMDDVNPEVQEKVAEADALGRIMARSFIEEQQNMSFAGGVQEKVAEALEDISDFWAIKVAEEEMADEEDEEDEEDAEDEAVAKTAMLHLADELMDLGEYGAAIKVAAAPLTGPKGLRSPLLDEHLSDLDMRDIGLGTKLKGGGVRRGVLSSIPGVQNLAAGRAALGYGSGSAAKGMRVLHKALAAQEARVLAAEAAHAAIPKADVTNRAAAKAALDAEKASLKTLAKPLNKVRGSAYKHLAAGGAKMLGAAGGLGLAGYGAYRALGGGQKTAAAPFFSPTKGFSSAGMETRLSDAERRAIGMGTNLVGNKNRGGIMSYLPGGEDIMAGRAGLGYGKGSIGKGQRAALKAIQAQEARVLAAEAAHAAIPKTDVTNRSAAKAALSAERSALKALNKPYSKVRGSAYRRLAVGGGKMLGAAGGLGLAGYGAYKALGGGDNEYKTAGYEFAKLAEERAAEIMLANGIDPQTFESVYPTEVKIAHVVTPDDVWTYEEKIAAAEFNEQLDEAALHILESIGLA
jgi:hypothetical protein